LQNKRGVLKPPFKLPAFIEATGIAKVRDPFLERDGTKMVKQKMRDRMNPRMGKIEIDYEVLYDAFFKN
jgi:splicing factor 3B subunit 2